jgi:ubiquinone/menaquinone biosynthesis C-methylase UbiE
MSSIHDKRAEAPIMDFKSDLPPGFDAPTALPKSESEGKVWQDFNRKWWESNPMRYDWTDPLKVAEFSPEFYREIDRRFFLDAKQYMPWKEVPFDPLIDYAQLATKDVLEIGVGNGSHAQLLASNAKSFTGIDLTEYAVKSTSQRFKCFSIEGRVLQMDAESLAFPNNSFDFVWSWGVIHHSANTAGILQEMHRVLRPGGSAVVMVYHRNFWKYYVMSGLFHGVIRGELFKKRSLHEILQRTTDGAIARYYSLSEWQDLVSALFESKVRIYGQKSEMFPLPAGAIKRAASGAIPDAITRFFTNTCGFGTFLVSTMIVRK